MKKALPALQLTRSARQTQNNSSTIDKGAIGSFKYFHKEFHLIPPFTIISYI
jgi:hypothetical protein